MTKKLREQQEKIAALNKAASSWFRQPGQSEAERKLSEQQKRIADFDKATANWFFQMQTEQADSRRKRQPIARAVRNVVWNRDGGVCVECGSNENLEFDHIIPHSKGGSDTERNIQLLCMKCNRTKYDKI
ncbi:HNH endonuclease [Citrifermentans bemidjiense]|nr:HNH endonuclease signature motif containing protein [Citrifermentans bemidjiense]